MFIKFLRKYKILQNYQFMLIIKVLKTQLYLKKFTYFNFITAEITSLMLNN